VSLRRRQASPQGTERLILWGRLLGVPSGSGRLLIGPLSHAQRNSRTKPRALKVQLMTTNFAYSSIGGVIHLMSLAGILGIAIPLVTAPHLRAQSQDMAASFEAASIKPTQMTGQGASIDRHSGMLLMKNVTLQDCIREAYGVTDSQIAGQDRLSSDRYDIVAKIPPGVASDQHPAMLQALLAERFKLAVHRGTKEMPVYLLVVAKNGPKMGAALLRFGLRRHLSIR
jgi:hypothetical protein